jgi:hypothetical protein
MFQSWTAGNHQRSLKLFIARRNPDFLTSLAAFRAATHIRLRSPFSGPITLLAGYLQRENFDFTQHRL